MRKNEILEKVIEEVREKIDPCLMVNELRIGSRLMNNSVESTGIEVTFTNRSEKPIFYMDVHLMPFAPKDETVANSHVDLENLEYSEVNIPYLCGCFLSDLARCMRKMDKILPDQFEDALPEDIQKHLFFSVANFEQNQKLLWNHPYFKFLDLAIFPCWKLSTNPNDRGHFMISRRLSNIWGLSDEKLFRMAMNNMPKLYHFVIRPLSDVLREETELSVDDTPLILAGCKEAHYGPAILLYPKYLKEISKKAGGSFYVLPTSVDEVLIAPENACQDRTVADLYDMMKFMNSNMRMKSDILSDAVYFYNAEENHLMIAEK
ncbi:MAG: DUF5688 family protein [Lachnospiraceae bacterium]|nr:DUF5688 family protein [Lachnospiraceae bacterium]